MFESCRSHGCLCLVFVLCCQVEISSSADHSSRGVLIECALYYFDRNASIMRSPCSTWGCCDFWGGVLPIILMAFGKAMSNIILIFGGGAGGVMEFEPSSEI